MGFMKRRRVRQVIKYGWKDAEEISKYPEIKKSKISIFLDILHCFKKYYVFSNQYKNNRIWEKPENEKTELGDSIGKSNMKRDEWLDDYYENRRFLNKYTSRRYETSPKLIQKRQKAYSERYKLGENCTIQFNVEFSREHQLNGTLKVGNNVVFAKNVFIDYSGEVIVDDNVKIAAGVSMESHHRDLEAYQKGKDVNIPTQLHICEGAYIGTHAIILDSCNYIGKHARIGAGAVVVKDIPDYSVAVGVPAKVVKEIEH